jgi:hypothetical protein
MSGLFLISQITEQQHQLQEQRHQQQQEQQQERRQQHQQQRQQRLQQHQLQYQQLQQQYRQLQQQYQQLQQQYPLLELLQELLQEQQQQLLQLSLQELQLHLNPYFRLQALYHSQSTRKSRQPIRPQQIWLNQLSLLSPTNNHEIKIITALIHIDNRKGDPMNENRAILMNFYKKSTSSLKKN